MDPCRVLVGGCAQPLIAAQCSPLLAIDPVCKCEACPGAADGEPYAEAAGPQGAAGDGTREFPGGGPGARDVHPSQKAGLRARVYGKLGYVLRLL